MKTKFRILSLIMAVAITASLAFGLASAADDGVMFRKNISKTPDFETGQSDLKMMNFYVPGQTAAGVITPIEYYVDDGSDTGVLVDTREFARPLVSSYIDDIGHETLFPTSLDDILGPTIINTGIGFGHRDAFMAVSLDDGATWKTTNVSRSQDLSSFTLTTTHLPYPGDVYRMEFAVAGDRVLAVWMSRYCASGSPLYAYDPDDPDDAAYLAAMRTYAADLDLLYDQDIWGVTGSQGSVNYTEQGYPEVGEIPYGCVWTARGTLEPVELDDEQMGYDIVWRKAERLTSGKRDPNVESVAGAVGAGFVIVWQEDPEGLRPGKGLGPGEGWSGAIVNSKTDMWYSYIDWDYFDAVLDDDTQTIMSLEEYITLNGDDYTMPKPGVAMAIPSRITDNNLCKGDAKYDSSGNLLNAYCYYDFETYTQFDGPNSDADLCAETVSWTNPGGTTLNVCVSEDGRVLTGRNGSSRTRMGLVPYTKGDGTISAWVVMAYEELKAMGDEIVDPETGEIFDIGKDLWYHTFDMFHPEYGQQGMMLNQPAKDWDINSSTYADFYPVYTDEWGNELYETEIARRSSLIIQPASKVGPSKTVAFMLFKQGIINQGGPADILARRFVLPETFDGTVDNPYDYANMVCETWEYDDGLNPNYLKGLCMDPAVNVSGSTIVACDDGSSGDTCAQAFWAAYDPLTNSVSEIPKVSEWTQYQDGSIDPTGTDLDDQPWENPFDVAKGHRGFLDGDFLMLMYAWSPNWKANSVGNDHYNLYVRRSFDGGLTFTTLPQSFTPVGYVDPLASWVADGSETCENFYVGKDDFDYETDQVCTFYDAGEFEPARNVSQMIGNKVTVLDPRFSPVTPTLWSGEHEYLLVEKEYLYLVDADHGYYPDDLRNPSRYFVVYETGDNSVQPEFAAIPLDLFFSRGYNFGDEYDYVEFTTSSGQLVQRWDWLENAQDDLSGEAMVQTTPSGSFFYAVWNQWQELIHDVITDSDSIFRRVMYNDYWEVPPTAEVLFLSDTFANTSEDLLFLGTAWDNDQLGGFPGIEEYVWESSVDGVVCREKQCNIPARNLSPGWHGFSFKAKDKEGRWSPGVTFEIYITEEPVFHLYLPLSIHP